MFTTIDSDVIKQGDATDAYFLRTEEALDEAGRNPEVVAEVSADQFSDGNFEVFAGLDDVTELLEGLPIDVDSLDEGRYFDGGPVMRLTGNYRDFARYETALLGFLSHASGMATEADAAVQKVTEPDVSLLSFGSRHVHPAIGGMLERSAFIAGFDGYSYVAAEGVIPGTPSGTMPHALILSFGKSNQAEAFTAFNDGVDEDVPRIALCDTFSDEIEEVRMAVETLGDDLDGVRVDTTSSRRGNFRDIIREINWLLDELGRSDVDVYISGGIRPENIEELQDIVDGFGIGSHVSNAEPVDFGLDIVEIEGEPISKRGKLSGVKNVVREGGEHKVTLDERDDDLLKPLIRDGDVVREWDVVDARETVADERDYFNL